MRGDGRIFERGSTWWIAYYLKGQERREPAGRTKNDAKNLLKARRKELLLGKITTPDEERLTVTQLLDALDTHLEQRGAKSLDSVKSHEKPVRAFFATLRAREVNADQLHRYIETRLGMERARATINRELELLRQAFRLAYKQERLSRVPFISMLHLNNRRTGFFEKRELDRVANHLPVPIDDIARFAFLSGWRKSEILGSRWEHVDRTSHLLILPDSKNGRARTLPLTGDLGLIIDRQWKRRTYTDTTGTQAISPFLFHDHGSPIVDLRKRWTTACTKAKVPGRLFHDLRRSAIRNMIRAGVPQSVAMEISGHTTDSVFRRYAITDETQKRQALEITQALLATEPATDTLATLPANREHGQNTDNQKKKGLAETANPKT